jgi:hypothetical protein
MNANVFPNLGYRDARAAIRFLIEAFGFEEVAVLVVRSDAVTRIMAQSRGPPPEGKCLQVSLCAQTSCAVARTNRIQDSAPGGSPNETAADSVGANRQPARRNGDSAPPRSAVSRRLSLKPSRSGIVEQQAGVGAASTEAAPASQAPAASAPTERRPARAG